jgi:hypothetical protein
MPTGTPSARKARPPTAGVPTCGAEAELAAERLVVAGMFVQQLDKGGVVKRLQIAAEIDLASSPAAGLGVQVGQLGGAQDDQTEGNAVLAERPLHADRAVACRGELPVLLEQADAVRFGAVDDRLHPTRDDAQVGDRVQVAGTALVRPWTSKGLEVLVAEPCHTTDSTRSTCQRTANTERFLRSRTGSGHKDGRFA